MGQAFGRLVRGTGREKQVEIGHCVGEPGATGGKGRQRPLVFRKGHQNTRLDHDGPDGLAHLVQVMGTLIGQRAREFET